MVLQKFTYKDIGLVNMKPLDFVGTLLEASQSSNRNNAADLNADVYVDIDLREVYFLIMRFLSSGPCQRTYRQIWNELLEYRLLPRRYHAWYSRSGASSGRESDDMFSCPLSYGSLIERYPHVEKDHLVKLLKQLLMNTVQSTVGANNANAADVPTLLGSGPFSLLNYDGNNEEKPTSPPSYMRWPHMHANQVHGLSLREIGGFRRHLCAPSIRAACYVIAKPSTMLQKMQNIKKVRGHRNAVYCAIFDCSGRFVITGSDDRLVKIWSLQTACCLASCRGHEGDITDLAVSSNNTMVASSSNDFVIRVWHLPDGYPLSVLRGHAAAVTAITFNPRQSALYQLLSSSDDGTCRIWDCRYSSHPPRIYVPKPDSVTGKNYVPSTCSIQRHQISCCSFNASGTIFVTGSSDTFARVWTACKFGSEESEQPNNELDILSGHENEVNYVQFSGCGVSSKPPLFDAWKEDNNRKFRNSWFTQDNIVTCSRDGSAIIWIPKSRRSHGRLGRWTKAYHLRVPPPPMPPQPPRGGPRQRVIPPPRGVNMIVWSLDNRFVLAAIMDCRICVWNAVTGNLVHSLTGHTESTYVLDVHPFNPRIAMSAGYDGKTIVWDIWEGKPVRIFEIGRFKLVDGKFSLDGMSIVLSDDVGQLYILSTGQGDCQREAKYDQFFLGDYRPIIQDSNGNVLDQETQLLAYMRNMQDLLCDSGMIPYAEPYQSVYQKQRFGLLGKQNEWRPLPVALAVGTDIIIGQDYALLPLPDLDTLFETLPEFVDALDWGPEIEVQTEDNDSEYNAPDYSSSSGGEERSFNAAVSGESMSAGEESDGRLRRSRRRKQKNHILGHLKKKNPEMDEDGALHGNTSRTVKRRKRLSKRKRSAALKPRRAAARKALSLFTRFTSSSFSSDEEEEEEDDDDDLEEDAEEEEEAHSSETDSSLQNLDVGDDETSLSERGSGSEATAKKSSACHVNGNGKRLVFRLAVRDSNDRQETRRDDSSNFTLCDGRIKWGGVRTRTSKRLRPGEGASQPTAPLVVDEQEGGCAERNGFSSRTSAREERESPGDNNGLSNVEKRPSSLARLRIKSKGKLSGGTSCPRHPDRSRRSRSLKDEEGAEESTSTSYDLRMPKQATEAPILRPTRIRRPNTYFHDTVSSSSPEKKRKLSWLMLSTHEEGSRYIPQKGDDIVYIRQGHQEYMDFTGPTGLGPCGLIKGRVVGAVEFCRVETMEYSTVPGSGESCCKMWVKFTDGRSDVFGTTFRLTLPEVTGFPDFLVERTRYDAAMERNWTCRDKCQVWWKNEGEVDGSWWHGRIMAVSDKSPEDFPQSPWERFLIQYKSNPKEMHRHSPWELYDTDTVWEPPRIHPHSRTALLACFSRLENAAHNPPDYYGVEKLKQVSNKSNFLNRFPVPISLEVIRVRVENNYYRSLDAVRHDVHVMLANAESYFEKKADMSEKIRRLSSFFTQAISSL